MSNDYFSRVRSAAQNLIAARLAEKWLFGFGGKVMTMWNSGASGLARIAAVLPEDFTRADAEIMGGNNQLSRYFELVQPPMLLAMLDSLQAQQLPAIGHPWPGGAGIYAGVMSQGANDVSDYHLIVSNESGFCQRGRAMERAQDLPLLAGVHYGLPRIREMYFLRLFLRGMLCGGWHWTSNVTKESGSNRPHSVIFHGATGEKGKSPITDELSCHALYVVRVPVRLANSLLSSNPAVSPLEITGAVMGGVND